VNDERINPIHEPVSQDDAISSISLLGRKYAPRFGAQ
jgi:hypothetical protein